MSDNLMNMPITTPTGNKIYLRREENKVFAKVCKDTGECKEEVLLVEYNGFGWAKLAEESKNNLEQLIANRDLYEGYIAQKKDGRLVIDNSWSPWMPFTAVTLVDLSQENLTKAGRDEKVGEFMVNLWISGIWSAAEIARVHIDKLEKKFWFTPWAKVDYRPRDAKLQGYLELASAYFQAENYKKVEDYVNEITKKHKLTFTTARPIFTDEAFFLFNEAKRIEAIKTWSVEFMDQAMDALLENEKKLRKLELGYRVRYNYELLKTCVMYEKIFPGTDWRSLSHCEEEKLINYADNVTMVYNKRSPIFNDNFIAVRTFLQIADHYQINGDFEKATHEYLKAVYLVNFIKNTRSVKFGDIDLNWEIFSPHMGPFSRTVGKLFGKKAALSTFAVGSDIARLFRGDFGLDWRKIQSDQFNPKFFIMFEAQAYRGLAGIAKKRADMDPSQSREYLEQAKQLLEIAHARVKQIKHDDIIDFYSKKRFEERMNYYDVLVDYAEVLINLQSIGKNLSSEQLQLAEKSIAEVVRDKSDEPTDVTYLKALLVHSDLRLNQANYQAAVQGYNFVLNGISQVEAKLKGISLPPFYQYLRAIALGRLALISEISK